MITVSTSSGWTPALRRFWRRRPVVGARSATTGVDQHAVLSGVHEEAGVLAIPDVRAEIVLAASALVARLRRGIDEEHRRGVMIADGSRRRSPGIRRPRAGIDRSRSSREHLPFWSVCRGIRRRTSPPLARALAGRSRGPRKRRRVHAEHLARVKRQAIRHEEPELREEHGEVVRVRILASRLELSPERRILGTWVTSKRRPPISSKIRIASFQLSASGPPILRVTLARAALSGD